MATESWVTILSMRLQSTTYHATKYDGAELPINNCRTIFSDVVYLFKRAE
jgi:hypothetical protein